MRLTVAAVATVTLGFAVPPAPAHAVSHTRPDRAPVLRVGGSVSTPASYTRAQLTALPQVTLTDQREGRHTLSGVLLQTVIQASSPTLPQAKNAQLQVVADVSGRAADRHRTGHQRGGHPQGNTRVAVALGELDPGFGNHPGLLVLQRDGVAVRSAPELTFPSDTNHRRDVGRVTSIDIRIADATVPDVTAGSLQISDGRRTRTLSSARLHSLPQRTVTVSFLASGSPQTHTEQGPSLAAVLRAARIPTGSNTSVTGVGVDGYAAAATPGEATSGGRTLLISLREDGAALTRPRLVPAGDVKGGRYVSDLVSLVVQHGSRLCGAR